MLGLPNIFIPYFNQLVNIKNVLSHTKNYYVLSLPNKKRSLAGSVF